MNTDRKKQRRRRRRKSFICQFCQYETSSQRAITDHLRVHTGEKPFKCDICGHAFAQKSNLSTHQVVHGTAPPGMRCWFECSLCEFKTKWKHSLTIHMRAHNGEQPYQCDICGRAFAQKSNLHTHQIVHGTAPASYTLQLQCSLCAFQTNRKLSLTIHMRAHNGEQPYQCKLCDQRFSQSTHRNTHMREVHGDSPRRFRCTICSKAYKRLDHLQVHALCHTGKKAFSCDVCKKAFYTSYLLKLHARIHQGESSKTHACKLCNHRTRYAQALRIHCELIHGIPYRTAKDGHTFRKKRQKWNSHKSHCSGHHRKGEGSLKDVAKLEAMTPECDVKQAIVKRKVGRPCKNADTRPHDNVLITTAPYESEIHINEKCCKEQIKSPTMKRSMGRPRKNCVKAIETSKAKCNKTIDGSANLPDMETRCKEEIGFAKRKVGRPRKNQLDTIQHIGDSQKGSVVDFAVKLKSICKKEICSATAGKRKIGRPRKYDTTDNANVRDTSNVLTGKSHGKKQMQLPVSTQKIGRPRKNCTRPAKGNVTNCGETTMGMANQDVPAKRKLGRPRKYANFLFPGDNCKKVKTGKQVGTFAKAYMSKSNMPNHRSQAKDKMPILKGRVGRPTKKCVELRRQHYGMTTKHKVGRPRKTEQPDISSNAEKFGAPMVLGSLDIDTSSEYHGHVNTSLGMSCHVTGSGIPHSRPMKRGRPKVHSDMPPMSSVKKSKRDQNSEKHFTNGAERKKIITQKKTRKKGKPKKVKMKHKSHTVVLPRNRSTDSVVVHEHDTTKRQSDTSKHSNPITISEANISHQNLNVPRQSTSRLVKSTAPVDLTSDDVSVKSVSRQADRCVYNSLRAIAVDFELPAIKMEPAVQSEMARPFGDIIMHTSSSGTLFEANGASVNRHNSPRHCTQLESRTPFTTAQHNSSICIKVDADEITSDYSAQRNESYTVDGDRRLAEISHIGNEAALSWNGQLTPTESSNDVYPLNLITVREKTFHGRIAADWCRNY